VLRLLSLTLAGVFATGVHFSALPRQALQGSQASIAVSGGQGCLLLVRYADGTRQSLGASRTGKWRWVVPGDAATGRATASVACARGGSAARTVMVVGSVAPARIGVVKSGYSIRALSYGGTDVSYGVLLKNTSANQDALGVSALVNFVDGSNNVIGSANTSIDAVPAGGTYALGGDLSFPGAAPVVRLEVVLQIGSRKKKGTLLPALSNIHVVPDPYDPGWVGSVQGEVANDLASVVLQRAAMSAVVLDASGNVIGGGTGYVFASLPPGAREFFSLGSGFRAIPSDRAASAVISVSPTFSQAAP
jgi:hypothetical protein